MRMSMYLQGIGTECKDIRNLVGNYLQNLEDNGAHLWNY